MLNEVHLGTVLRVQVYNNKERSSSGYGMGTRVQGFDAPPLGPRTHAPLSRFKVFVFLGRLGSLLNLV